MALSSGWHVAHGQAAVLAESLVVAGQAVARLPLPQSLPAGAQWLPAETPLGEILARARVPHGTSGLRLPAVLQGFVEPAADTEALVAALVAGLREADSLDEDAQAVVKFFLTGKPCALAPIAALSAIVGVSRKKFPALCHRAAAALCQLGHARVSRLEAALVGSLPRAHLICYIESVQYDETPLRARIVGDREAEGPAPVPGAGPGPGQIVEAQRIGGDMIVQLGGSKSMQVFASKAAQKIVQTQADIGFVVRIGHRLATITLRPVLALAVVERTTAACLQQQQLSISQVGRAARAFKSQVRAATTDAYSANKAAEASIASVRGAAASGSLHVLCAVHGTAGVYDKTFGLVDSHISGVIRVALSLQNGPAMARFRKCLRAEIASRLEILKGVAPASAVEYKKKVMGVFVRHGGGVVKRRALLALCPNGEWRAPKVQYYVNPQIAGEITDPKVILSHLTNGLVMALASAQPACYNRHRWTGSDIAVDQLAVFEAVHRLLSTTYARFCASFRTGAPAVRLLQLAQDLAEYDGVPGGQQQALELEPEVVAGPPGEAEPAGPVPMGEDADPAAAAAAPQGAQGALDFAAANARERQLALQFLRGGCMGTLVLMRLLMEPLRQYLGKQFERAGEDWEQAEQAKLARAQMAGQSYQRQFRILHVASGEDDSFFSAQLRLVFTNAELWSLMPPSRCTVSMRALAFRCLARMGCAHSKLLRGRHEGYPYKTLCLLSDPGRAAEILAMPDCLLDPWTLALRKEYPTLAGEEVQQVLYSMASLVRVDISHVESRHASIRRMLFGRSVQTHALSFPDLSAQWVFQQHRTRRSRQGARGLPSGPAATGPSAKRGAGARKKVRKTHGDKAKGKRSGHGGAWRAWMRIRTSGQPLRSIDHAGEAAAYRAAAQARTAEYLAAERLGRMATAHGRRTGRHGFGGGAPQHRRSQKRLVEAGLALQLQRWVGDDCVEGSFALAEHARAVEASVESTLAVARRLARLKTKEKAEAKAADLASLETYRATTGAEGVRVLQQALPELAAFPMRGEPAGRGVHISVEMPDPQEMQAATGWVCSHPHASGLAGRLQALWALLHQTLMETDCPEVLGTAAQSRCLAAGVCLCSEEGLEFDRRVNKFRNHVKQVCPMGSRARLDLIEGRLMVRIVGRPVALEDMLAEDGEQTVELWLHIGLHYLSPYEPTFHIVERTADPGEAAPDDRRVYVRSTGEFRRLHEGLAPLRQSSGMWTRWYCLEDADRPVADLKPEPVAFVELPGFRTGKKIWPRAQAAPRQRRAPDPEAEPGPGAEEPQGPDEAEDLASDEDLAEEADDEAPGFMALLEPLLDAFEGEGLLAGPEPERIREAVVGPAAPGGDGSQQLVAMPGSSGPPPPPARPAGRKRPRAGDQLMILLENGSITYFPSNGRFEAKCSVHAGQRCTLTRKGIGEAAGSQAPAGSIRPLGLLAAWLATGVLCDDKESHRDADNLRILSGPEQRLYRYECRQELAGCPGAQDLFDREAIADGEGIEAEPATVR